MAEGWSQSQPSVGESCVHPGCGALIKRPHFHRYRLFFKTGLERNPLFQVFTERYVNDCSHDFLPNDEYLLDIVLCSPQICVGKLEDGETFLKVSSGKKRGLVPADSIEEI